MGHDMVDCGFGTVWRMEHGDDMAQRYRTNSARLRLTISMEPMTNRNGKGGSGKASYTGCGIANGNGGRTAR